MSTMNFGIVTNDPDHPSVKAIAVTASAKGDLPIEVRDRIAAIPGFPKGLVPQEVSKGVACKRAVETLKDPDTKTATTGRKGTAAHSVYVLDPSKLDRETSDGKGVADTRLTARVVPTETGDGVYVKVDPPDHPAAAYLRQKTDDLEKVYSCTYDLKVWFTQRFLPYIGAIKSPDAQGKYLLPKHNNEEGWRLLKALRAVFYAENAGGKLRIYCEGIVPGDSEDAVDLIADAMQDEIERVCSRLEGELDKMDKGEKRIGKRGLATLTGEAHSLRERLQKMRESYGMAQEDSYAGIEEIEKRLGLAELALDDE